MRWVLFHDYIQKVERASMSSFMCSVIVCKWQQRWELGQVVNSLWVIAVCVIAVVAGGILLDSAKTSIQV